MFNTSGTLSRLKINLRALSVTIIKLIIKSGRYRIAAIKAAGVIKGLATLGQEAGRWKAIARFARQMGSPLPPWLFLLKYFVQRGIDSAWGIAYTEAPQVLERYMVVENAEVLEQAARENQGLILLGAHYGPALFTFLLYQMDIMATTLVNQDSYNIINRDREALNALRCNMWKFWEGIQDTLVVTGSEKKLVNNLKSGGTVIMIIDLPLNAPEGEVVDFFGLPLRFSYFPFKLALRYKIPVYFCFFSRSTNGGYRLSIAPSGNFSNPFQGVKGYVASLQERVAAYPYMWRILPEIMEFPRGGNKGASHHPPPTRGG
jgi:lauroyl/myristoyl acyltransferase